MAMKAADFKKRIESIWPHRMTPEDHSFVDRLIQPFHERFYEIEKRLDKIESAAKKNNKESATTCL